MQGIRDTMTLGMLKRSALAVLLSATALPATAAISPGNEPDGDPTGELFFTVWDEANQVSYTRDLGINIIEFLNDFFSTPAATFSLGPDSRLSTFISNSGNPSSLVWGLGGFNNRFADFPQAFGQLITSNNPSVFLPDFSALQTASTTGGVYARGANDNDSGPINDYDLDLSSTSVPGQAGYYGGPNWNGNLGNTVPFNTAAAVGESLGFFALLLDANGTDVNTTQATGRWTLALDGTLSYGPDTVIPLPASALLFVSATTLLLGAARRKKDADIAAR